MICVRNKEYRGSNMPQDAISSFHLTILMKLVRKNES